MQLPYFMNELSLTDLDMGCSMPQISSTSRPELNQRGEHIGHLVKSTATMMDLRWPMVDVITSEVYAAIRCCYPAVISKCTRPLCPGLQHFGHISIVVCIWYRTKGNLRTCPLMWEHYPPSARLPVMSLLANKLVLFLSFLTVHLLDCTAGEDL